MLIRSYLKGGNGEARKEPLKNKIDWKEMGQVFALITQLYTIISRICKDLKVDLGILEWVTKGEGLRSFETKLNELGQLYLYYTTPIQEVYGVDLYSDDDTPWPEHVPMESMHRYASNTPISLWHDGVRIPENVASPAANNWRKVVLFPIPLPGDRAPKIPLKRLLQCDPANHAFLDFFLRNRDCIPSEWENALHFSGEPVRFAFVGTEYRLKSSANPIKPFVRYMTYSRETSSWLEGFASLEELEAMGPTVQVVCLTSGKN